MPTTTTTRPRTPSPGTWTRSSPSGHAVGRDQRSPSASWSDGKINRFIPNPTWDPVSKPGALDEYFRGRNPKGDDTPTLFGELDRLADHPEYQNRDARLALMDAQGCRAPSSCRPWASAWSRPCAHDVPALIAAFRAFNRWMDEDWGFAYQERIFAAPYITLVDPDNAVVRVAVGPRPRRPLHRDGGWPGRGRRYGPLAGRSRVRPLLVAGQRIGCDRLLPRRRQPLLAVPDRLGRERRDGGVPPEPLPGPDLGQPHQDNFANLLAHGLFARYPNLRLASIETGSAWVFHLFEKLKKSFGQTPQAYPEDPRETFKRHVWVSPFYEDELGELRDLLGADHILMGSDFPHAEGLAEPVVLPQGPAELQLLRRGLPPGHARQRDGPLTPPAGVTVGPRTDPGVANSPAETVGGRTTRLPDPVPFQLVPKA